MYFFGVLLAISREAVNSIVEIGILVSRCVVDELGSRHPLGLLP
jgi:hypothetical protein